MGTRRSEELSRQFRKAMTPAEARLWEVLRDRRVTGMKFRRQHPFGGIIADFYCPERALVVEVDGGVHLDPDQRERDRLRDIELSERGLTILRFTNEEVERSLAEVIAAIQATPSNQLNDIGGDSGPSLPKVERGARRAG